MLISLHNSSLLSSRPFCHAMWCGPASRINIPLTSWPTPSSFLRFLKASRTSVCSQSMMHSASHMWLRFSKHLTLTDSPKSEFAHSTSLCEMSPSPYCNCNLPGVPSIHPNVIAVRGALALPGNSTRLGSIWAYADFLRGFVFTPIILNALS